MTSTASHLPERAGPTVAALLAAGSGSRYKTAGGGASHKLLAPVNGHPLWHLALQAVIAADFDRVVVVTGAVDLELPPDAPSHVELRHNPRWHTGQASSVQTAITVASELGANWVTIGLADQPGIPSEAWRAVAGADPNCRIVVARYGGAIGPNPVRLRADVWPLLPTDGDKGARSLIRMRSEWVCHVDCAAPEDAAFDIDTPEDLQRWNSC